jgi:hypothetical protein
MVMTLVLTGFGKTNYDIRTVNIQKVSHCVNPPVIEGLVVCIQGS